jgi:hypothetical protein
MGGGAGAAVGLFSTGVGILTGIRAEGAAASANARASRKNAAVARAQAAQAVQRGEEEANRVRVMERRVIGAQRAALAAQGIAVDVGTAVDLQQDVIRSVQADIMTIRHNAALEAWGYEHEARGFRTRAAIALAEGRARQTEILLGGISRVAEISSGFGDGDSTRRTTTGTRRERQLV